MVGHALVLSITMTAITMIAIASPNIDRASVNASIYAFAFVPQILVIMVCLIVAHMIAETE